MVNSHPIHDISLHMIPVKIFPKIGTPRQGIPTFFEIFCTFFSYSPRRIDKHIHCFSCHRFELFFGFTNFKMFIGGIDRRKCFMVYGMRCHSHKGIVYNLHKLFMGNKSFCTNFSGNYPKDKWNLIFTCDRK